MGYITINGKKVEFTDEKNVLSIIRKAGIDIPTLCYHSELSTFGACRLCTVEDERGRLFASCSEEPRDGMVIYTHTERLRKHRKLIVELLLAAHCRDCTTCVKSGECKLQELAHNMGVLKVRYENYNEIRPVDYSSPAIVRDPNKCILCGNCVRVCSELQGIGVLGFANRGTEATVTPAFEKKLSETDCVSCGQCRVFCPTGALTIRTNMDEVWKALGDKDTRVVAQIAPAVRVAVGDAFGMKNGENVMGKIVAALHAMGVDEVYDTTYTADLTIMEESAEFLDRVANGGKLPLLTSCCPAWVKFVGDQFPDMKEHVSTCRSPQQMFFRMNMNELATASRNKLPLIEVVVNNHVLGMVRQWQTLFYKEHYSATILDDGVDFVKVAEALGCEARRVTTREEFEAAFAEALECKIPFVIDCIIDSDDKVWPMVAPGAPINEAFDATDVSSKA